MGKKLRRVNHAASVEWRGGIKDALFWGWPTNLSTLFLACANQNGLEITRAGQQQSSCDATMKKQQQHIFKTAAHGNSACQTVSLLYNVCKDFTYS